MLLALSLQLTTQSLQYEEMIRQSGHLQGRELELHKLRMEYLAEEIRQLREKFARIMDGRSQEAYNQYHSGNSQVSSHPHSH